MISTKLTFGCENSAGPTSTIPGAMSSLARSSLRPSIYRSNIQQYAAVCWCEISFTLSCCSVPTWHSSHVTTASTAVISRIKFQNTRYLFVY